MTAKVSECTIRPRGEIMSPGRGLSEGWFDGCTGYFNTLDRFNSWDFTSPYLASAATFRVKKGNPSGFDPSSFSLKDFTIGETFFGFCSSLLGIVLMFSRNQSLDGLQCRLVFFHLF